MVLTQGEALGVTKPHQFQSSANRVAIICDFILGGAIICYYFNQKKLGLLFQLFFLSVFAYEGIFMCTFYFIYLLCTFISIIAIILDYFGFFWIIF